MLAQFGDPNFSQWAGLSDPAAVALANQTTASGNSVLSRLGQTHDLARQGVINSLAGSGLLFSGDTGYRTGLADKAYSQSVYDAEQTVLQQIAGLQNTRLSADTGFQNNVTSALSQAWQNFVANPSLYAPNGQKPTSIGTGIYNTTQQPSNPNGSTLPSTTKNPYATATAKLSPTNFQTDASSGGGYGPKKKAVVNSLNSYGANVA